MKSKAAALLGIGTALPSFSINQKDAARAAIKFCSPKESRFIEPLYGLTRIQKRGSVVLEKDCAGGEPVQTFFEVRKDLEDRGPDTESRMKYYAKKAPGLALQAAREALLRAETRTEEIGQLVTLSCTGFSAPGFDIALMKSLNLLPGTGRTHIGFMGCHAMFNALRVASSLAQSTGQKVLVCSVELCSLHFSYDEGYDHVLSNALFADGASACVIGPAQDQDLSWKIAHSGSIVFPDSEDFMKWEIGNHGFAMKLSDKVPVLLSRNLKSWLTEWLSESGLTIESIKSWAIHPGGPRILDEIQRCLDLPPETLEASRTVLTQYGNMSSATILFILDLLRKDQAPAPCVALAFGPGLTVEAALLV